MVMVLTGVARARAPRDRCSGLREPLNRPGELNIVGCKAGGSQFSTLAPGTVLFSREEECDTNAFFWVCFKPLLWPCEDCIAKGGWLVS